MNKNISVILLSLNWTRDKDPRLPLGHASLLAALKDIDRKVESLVFPVNDKVDIHEIAKCILEIYHRTPNQPVDLAIGAYVWGESIIQGLLPLLRDKGFTGRIILGGPQISFMESGFESTYPDADVFVRGHGEQALIEITSSLNPTDLRGVHYAGNITSVTTALADLDSLPSPWLRHDWVAEPLKFVRFETMRGCPYSCSFCQHRAPDRKSRLSYLPESRIMQEIDLFCAQRVESIAVLDPIFNVSPLSTRVLETFVERGFRGRLSLQCRAERLKDEFLKAASQLDVTLEFGLQTIHDAESDAVDRRNEIDKVDQALAKVRSLGIHHEVSLIFGLPNQTLESFRQTVDWCLKRQVPVIKAFPLMLLRGTKLEIDAQRWSLQESKDEIPIVISSSTFTHDDWKKMNAISEALKKTEGRHSENVERLAISLASPNSVDRWSPPLITDNKLETVPHDFESDKSWQKGVL